MKEQTATANPGEFKLHGCDGALHPLEQRRYRQLSRAVGAAFLLLVAPLARAQGNVRSPNAKCPLEDALNFHVVQTLQVNGVTDKQFEDLAAAGEIKNDFPAVCLDELNNAKAKPDTTCQIVNGQALSRLSSYIQMAAFLFAVTGDAPALRANIRTILTNFLESVPHECWFQTATMPPPNQPSPVVRGKGLTPAQCAQLRAYYQACKQQAEQALKQCTVTPWNHNCASTVPTCRLPPC